MLRTLALSLHPQRRLVSALLAAALLATTLAVSRHTLAAGATITVTTSADELNEDGDCSLREALRAANRDQIVDACVAGRGHDLIGLPPGLFRLSRGAAGEDEGRGGDLDILRDLTLRGAGADRTVLVAATRDRLLDVFAPAAVTVEGLTLREGQAPEADPAGTPEVGGCVRSAGALSLVDVRLEGCAAAHAGGVASLGAESRLELLRSVVSGSVARAGEVPGVGGGIASEGELRLVDSSVVGNSGSLGGGIYSSGPASLLRSTVAGNSAAAATPDSAFGGGVFSAGELTLDSSTVSRNRANGGGGIYSQGGLALRDSTVAFNESAGGQAAGAGVRAAGVATARGSILAANRANGLPDDCLGLISLGANLFQAPCAAPEAGDITGDPLLGPLRHNGGHTLSHAPLEGSPAIDAGLGCEPADQRGIGRPRGAACDIGALERESARAPLAPAQRDGFSQGDARLRADWAGPGRAGYRVEGGHLRPLAGGPIYWLRDPLGQSQAATVALRAVDRSAANLHGLLLKVRRDRGRADWRAGAIRVALDGAAGEVRVELYSPAGGWRLARAFPAAFDDGDVLGARAFADGSVAAYRNGALLGVVDTRELPGVGDLFAGGDGYAGLWFEQAPGAVADDFAAE